MEEEISSYAGHQVIGMQCRTMNNRPSEVHGGNIASRLLSYIFYRETNPSIPTK